jgi:hypothetical protein
MTIRIPQKRRNSVFNKSCKTFSSLVVVAEKSYTHQQPTGYAKDGFFISAVGLVCRMVVQ